MRYTLLKMVVASVRIDDKVSTPVIGYILKDELLATLVFCDRKEAYTRVLNYGGTNIIQKLRPVKCSADIPDVDGLVYYLKMTDGTKMNEHLLSVADVETYMQSNC